MDADDLDRACSYQFGLRGLDRWAARQSDQRHYPSVARPFARVHHGVLSHRPKIRWEPVANVDEPFLHRWISLSVGATAKLPPFG